MGKFCARKQKSINWFKVDEKIFLNFLWRINPSLFVEFRNVKYIAIDNKLKFSVVNFMLYKAKYGWIDISSKAILLTEKFSLANLKI